MANFVEKESIFLRIAKYLIPWKGDKPVEIIRKIIFLAAAVVLVVSLVTIISFYGSDAQDRKFNQQISDIYHGSATVTVDQAKQDELAEEYPEVNEKFLPLLEQNKDVIGWITMGDPDDPFVDNVVVQGDDNAYYLDHNLNGDYSKTGTVFADYREKITPQNTPANTILYGHNVVTGEYFAKLTRYFNYRYGKDNGLDWYRKYPTITFNTLYHDKTYKIFAGMLVNTQEEDGEVFYYLQGRKFKTKAEFDDYIAQILDRTTFFTDVDLQYGDNLITLSTCILDYTVDCRWVIFGREVREGEDPTVDVDKAYEKPDPLYFDYYYRVYGGSWGGRKWDPAMIFDYSYSTGSAEADKSDE